MKAPVSTHMQAAPPRRPSSSVIGQPVGLAARIEADRQRTDRLISLCRTIERRLTTAVVVLGCAMLVVMAARMALAAWGQG